VADVNQPEPYFIDIVEPERSDAERIVDVLVGSFGLVGVLAIGALVVGGLVGGVLLWLRSRDRLGGG
jgi:hypothetical protein